MNTIERDAHKYVTAMRGPANGLGQQIIDGRQSHHFLRACYVEHGLDEFNSAVNLAFKLGSLDELI